MMIKLLMIVIVIMIVLHLNNHKIKNIVPIKDINSILKINKKVCSQAYLERCNFINDSD